MPGAGPDASGTPPPTGFAPLLTPPSAPTNSRAGADGRASTAGKASADAADPWRVARRAPTPAPNGGAPAPRAADAHVSPAHVPRVTNRRQRRRALIGALVGLLVLAALCVIGLFERSAPGSEAGADPSSRALSDYGQAKPTATPLANQGDHRA